MNIEQNISSDFFYQKKATLPSKYISEFHKFWEADQGCQGDGSPDNKI